MTAPTCTCFIFCDTCGYTYETGYHEDNSFGHQFTNSGKHDPQCPVGGSDYNFFDDDYEQEVDRWYASKGF